MTDLVPSLLVAQENTSLPFLTNPPDTLRDGLVTLKDGARAAHPVEVIQNSQKAGEAARMEMLQNVYGSALPARMQIERQLLERVGRLPGIPSSKLGLQSLTGTLDDFSFEAYLNLPDASEAAPPDMHAAMEKKLGMGIKK